MFTSTWVLVPLKALAWGLALLACGCSKPDSGPSEERNKSMDSSAPAACGRIVFAIGEAEDRVSIGIVDASGGAITTLAEAEVSMFPSALAPDARSVLALRSEPTPSGKTSDRLGLVGLEAGAEPRLFGPSGAALRNPS